MTDLHQSSQEGLVPAGDNTLATRSASLVGRGLDLIAKGQTILITDNEPSFREVVRFVLKDCGYVVVALESKIEALERLQEIKPDLVITDLMAPQLNGREFIRRVKGIDSSIPVIVISGTLTAENAREAAVQLGAFDCLPKPVDVTKLRQVVERALRTQRILCVDDEQSPLETYKYVLEPHGYEVVTALDSITALRIMEKEPVDLLIQDLGRPGINGFELYEMLKANERLKNIPVVICSGASTKKFLERYPNVEGALDKPFDVEHLVDVVRMALRSAVDARGDSGRPIERIG
jgi:CheY-like chemotaxis protein